MSFTTKIFVVQYMIAELQQAIENRLRDRNLEILQYIITHPTDYYHTQVKPKLLFVGEIMYYEGDELELDYWSVMDHFLRVN